MQKWLQPSWVIWLFNFCILPIVCDQSTVYICITHKKHYILFTFSWSRQAQRGFISFNFYRRFAHEKFFSRNMRSVCTSNRSVPASSCHSDHSVSTWLLVAVKCPGITPTPPRAELTNAVRWGITQSTWLPLSQDALAERRDKSEVSSGLGQKRGSVGTQVTAGLLAVQPVNGATLCPPAEAAEKHWGPACMVTTHPLLCHGHFRCI